MRSTISGSSLTSTVTAEAMASGISIPPPGLEAMTRIEPEGSCRLSLWQDTHVFTTT